MGQFETPISRFRVFMRSSLVLYVVSAGPSSLTTFAICHCWTHLLYPLHYHPYYLIISWWRHQMKTFSALLALCEGKPPITGGFHWQRAVTGSFDIFFHLCLNRRPSKQSRRWFETPSRSSWCHYNVLSNSIQCHHHPHTLQWRHNDRDDVSNHRLLDCLHNRLFSHQSKNMSKLRVTGLYKGNSPVTGEFPAQRASNAENVSIWWRSHHMNQHLVIMGKILRNIIQCWVDVHGINHRLHKSFK